MKEGAWLMVALFARTPVEDERAPDVPTHVMGQARGKSRRLLEEHLDPSRLDALHWLFEAPYQRGMDLFADLWHAALLQGGWEPEKLPGRSAGSGKTCLVVQNLPVLARQLGWSYDALSQYFTLFCLLGLIEKQAIHQGKGLCLFLPAGPYQLPPTLLSDLDALLARPARRPKLKRLARQIRERALSAGSLQASLSGESLPQGKPAGAPERQTATLMKLASHLTELTAEVTALQARLKQTEHLVRDLLASSEQPVLPRQDPLTLTAQMNHVALTCPGEESGLLSSRQADYRISQLLRLQRPIASSFSQIC
jgi:hypothetical protein